MIDFVRFRELIRQEESLKWKLEKLMANATKITRSIESAGGGSGTSSKVENGAILIEMLKEEKAEVESELKEMRKELTGRVRILRNPTMRVVMKMRYMKGINVQQLAIMLNYSEQHMFNTLKKAESIINQREKANPKTENS